ncbi:MAG TPA: STAS domain-containing protein [Gaiellaceae bacterium]|jgi:anti-anti-sigma factor|nr:STAS domain-containing protein [Gaiellaceae bacterium]
MLEMLGTLEAAELPNGDFVVAAHGPLDERIAGELRDTLLPLTAGGGNVVLDLADAHGLDARTLAIITCAAQLLRERDAELAIVTHSPFVRQLVSDAGIGALVVLHRSLAEAIRRD